MWPLSESSGKILSLCNKIHLTTRSRDKKGVGLAILLGNLLPAQSNTPSDGIHMKSEGEEVVISV